MQFTSSEQMHQIGNTIRSVSVAHAARFFKQENNTVDRAILVFGAIASEIYVALFDLGLTREQVLEVDPSEQIVEAMTKAGYPMGGLEFEYRMNVTDDCESEGVPEQFARFPLLHDFYDTMLN